VQKSAKERKRVRKKMKRKSLSAVDDELWLAADRRLCDV
jgi:hypothetical protein